MIIRAFQEGDLASVVNCFTESVRVIAARHYGAEQIEVWAPLEPDLNSWHARLSSGCVLIAEVQGIVAGVVRIERSGLVDLLYVDPTHERQGIGRELLNAACSWAAANGVKRFEANVSLLARPLFEAVGFRVEREQPVEYKGIAFRNFRMAREEWSVPAAEQANIRRLPKGDALQFTHRVAKQDDLRHIVEIYNATIPSRLVTADTEPVSVESQIPWFNEHTTHFRPLWVVEVDGHIGAWLSFSSFYGRPAYRKTAEVSIYVHELYRKRGLGSYLLAEALRAAPSLQLDTLLGFIFAHNLPSLALFDKFGFERWGLLPKVAISDDIERDLVIVGRRV